MYSLILMTAMASSGDSASFGGRFAHGCCGGAAVSYGCTGSSCSGYSCGGTSCNGYSCSGSSCSGYSCSGSSCCGGSSCHGARAGLFSRFHSCHGSSCSGYSCSGSSCGGYSCGGSSCAGYSSSMSYGTTYIVPEVAVATPAVTMTAPAATAVATLSIEVPAGAKLFVDGKPTAGETAVRTFSTPALIVGQAYYYDVKAEVTVAGRVVTEQKRVVVRASEKAVAKFGELLMAANNTTAAGVAAK